MRLKSLSLCLFALSLSGCSSHVIKSNSSIVQSLDQRAIQASNAIFESPSYDYNGTFQFSLDGKPANKVDQPARDAELEKQLRILLKAQRVNLSNAQLEQLYQAIAAENAKESSSLGFKKALDSVAGLLSETQFSYDGSIHYKQKLASFNFTTRYEKSNLLVQAKFPMVVDFKNYKFYTNYFALMPFMVNKESQSELAYLDFSKYKNEIEKVDLKSLVAYMKESGAVPYLLADPKDIQRVQLNEKDKAVGAVEKIRLNTSIEEFILQAALYRQVNKPYIQQKIGEVWVDQDEQDAVDEAIEARASVEESTQEIEHGLEQDEAEAYMASQKLYELVNESLSLDHDDENDDVELEETEDAIVDEIAGADEEEVSEDDELLSSADCQTLTVQKKRPAIGEIQYCLDEYEINVLSKDGDTNTSGFSDLLRIIISEEKSELSQLFQQYESEEFVDAQAFKLLWNKHQPEIQKALTRGSKDPIVIDIAIDNQGRVVRSDYDVSLKTPKSGTLKFRTDMNVLNYGKATPINRAELNRAKSIQEVTKGSILESIVNKDSESSEANSRQSLDTKMDELAVQVYDATNSYVKTYQALFILKMSAEQPEIVKLYNSKELNEIAQVYAYAYADESIYSPNAKEVAEIERLTKKHHLELDNQYNDYVGEDVYDKVVAVINGKKERQEWNRFVQQHKTSKSAFAEYYVTEFLADFDEDDLDATQKKELRKVAQILAQAYEDTRKNKLTVKSIQGLNADDTSYIDYGLYRTTFEKVSSSFK